MKEFEPHAVILDPISNFIAADGGEEVHSLLLRILDTLKARGVTALNTSLISGSDAEGESGTAVSSMMDTWIVLRNRERGTRWRKELFVLKSRGMGHSPHTMALELTQEGPSLTPRPEEGDR